MGHFDCRGSADGARSGMGRPGGVYMGAVMVALGFAVVAALTPTAQADGPTLQQQWLLDEDAGWSMEGEWEFGVPQGLGGDDFGNPDPTSGYTGENVYGVNLYGDYVIDIGGPYCLTMGPLDMSEMTQTSVHFWRWLNTDWLPWVSAKVQVSNDSTNWVTLWENEFVEIADDAWNHWALDISAVADNQATVWVRWSHEVLEGGTWAYSGWNIDDVEIWGMSPDSYPVGDLNCDGYLNFDDIDPFVSALTGQDGYEDSYPGCRWLNADVSGDGYVNFDDIDPFVELLSG